MNPTIWPTWLGKPIAKVSGGKFKSDEKVAVPQSIVPHPQHPRAIPAFVLEDGSVISCELCILVGSKPQWKDAPADAIAIFLNEAGEWEWSTKTDRTRKFNQVRPKEFMAGMDPVAREKVEYVQAQKLQTHAHEQRQQAVTKQCDSFRKALQRKVNAPPDKFKKGPKDYATRSKRASRLKDYVKLADVLLERGEAKEAVLFKLLVCENLNDGDFYDALDDYLDEGDEA